jgi:hypothetical protein
VGFGPVHTATQKGIEDMTWEQAMQTVVTADELKKTAKDKYVNTDRYEFDRFVARAGARMQLIDAALAAK